METLAIYLLKVHLSISILYIAYHLTVKNELFFKLNRFVLLSIIAVSFGLPLTSGLDGGSVSLIAGTNLNEWLPKVSPSDAVAGSEIAKFEDEVQIRRISGVIITILAFYLCGTLFYLSRFAGQIANVIKLVRSSVYAKSKNGNFLNPEDDVPAFSFFNSIVINPAHHNQSELELVLAHERAHARQWHSIDVMLAGLTSVILWGNPFARALKTSIRLNLEFLADQEVLASGFDRKSYQWSIISPYLNTQSYPLTNSFSSKPKQRIEKMNSEKKSIIYALKYALFIPFIVIIQIIVVPYRAVALDKIATMHMIDAHEYRDYLGYYEFEYDKGTFVQLAMKDNGLVMRTLWNNKKIFFYKQSQNSFFNQATAMQITFPKTIDGRITGMVAFGEDRWKKVDHYKPVEKKQSEGTVISRTSSGAIQVLVYAVEPWANVKSYAVAGP